MTDGEVAHLLQVSRTMTLATLGPTGHPHLVAMWYGLVDGMVCFSSKLKAQKVRNLERDRRVSVLLEAGEAYADLHGAAIEGTARIITDKLDSTYRDAGISLYERYTGPYTSHAVAAVDAMMTNRAVVLIKPSKVRSWDHRKLNGDRVSAQGSTAS